MSDKNPSLAQLEAILKLFKELGVSRARLTDLLASGVLADVLREGAKYNNRSAVRTALGLPNYRLTRYGHDNRFSIDDSSIMPLYLPGYSPTWPHEKALAEQNIAKVPAHRGVYEWMLLGAFEDASCTLAKLEKTIAAGMLAAGKWQRANEAHLTAFIRACHNHVHLLSVPVLAAGATNLAPAGSKTERMPCFVISMWMGGRSYDVTECNLSEPLGNIQVLYVRRASSASSCS